MFSWAFVDRVTLQTKTENKAPMGKKDVAWTDGQTYWASVLELPIKVVDYENNETQNRFFEVVLRGRQNFDVPSTRIYWQKNNMILKILFTSFRPSRSDVQYTILHCHEIENLLA